MSRFLRYLMLGSTAVVLLILAWPQLFGLQNTWVVAHVVALRGLFGAGAVVLCLILIGLALIRPLRRLALPLAILVLLFGAGNAAVLVARGLGNPADAAASATGTSSPAAGLATTGSSAGTSSGTSAGTSAGSSAGSSEGTASESPGAVTVLSWNTLGDAPGAGEIARLALADGADVVTLPETTEETGVAVAELMRAAGRPMWVHTVAFDLVSKARSTTLLISPDLGDYELASASGSGPPGNTNVLPTVVAKPVDGTGPTIIAVHAVAPINWEMSNWRSDLDWLALQCSAGDVIMAGDFNSTVDHMSGRAASAGAVLGGCADAALARGSGGVGTWPTFLPALLGSPIDHVLATPNWRVLSMTVLESEDAAGSDHRPILATLVPAAFAG